MQESGRDEAVVRTDLIMANPLHLRGVRPLVLRRMRSRRANTLRSATAAVPSDFKHGVGR
jgi:hypothetical protein